MSDRRKESHDGRSNSSKNDNVDDSCEDDDDDKISANQQQEGGDGGGSNVTSSSSIEEPQRRSGSFSGALTTTYRDYSRVPEPPDWPQERTNPNTDVQALRFHAKVRTILSINEYERFISWMPHGRSWIIHNKEGFTEHVLPVFFGSKIFNSFIRLVNVWGFRRKRHGPDKGSYYHELFLRGKPHLGDLMVHQSGKEKKQRGAEEPDLFSYPPLPEAEPPSFRIPPSLLSSQRQRQRGRISTASSQQQAGSRPVTSRVIPGRNDDVTVESPAVSNSSLPPLSSSTRLLSPVTSSASALANSQISNASLVLPASEMQASSNIPPNDIRLAAAQETLLAGLAQSQHQPRFALQSTYHQNTVATDPRQSLLLLSGSIPGQHGISNSRSSSSQHQFNALPLTSQTGIPAVSHNPMMPQPPVEVTRSLQHTLLERMMHEQVVTSQQQAVRNILTRALVDEQVAQEHVLERHLQQQFSHQRRSAFGTLQDQLLSQNSSSITLQNAIAEQQRRQQLQELARRPGTTTANANPEIEHNDNSQAHSNTSNAALLGVLGGRNDAPNVWLPQFSSLADPLSAINSLQRASLSSSPHDWLAGNRAVETLAYAMREESKGRNEEEDEAKVPGKKTK